MRAVERIGDAVDQVVVGLHAALPLEQRQARARVVAHAVQQGDAAAGEIVVAGLQRVEVRRRSARTAASRACGRCAPCWSWPASLRAPGVEIRSSSARGEIAGLAPRGQLRPQRVDPFGLVAAAVQHLAFERVQQHGEEVVAVRAEAIGAAPARAACSAGVGSGGSGASGGSSTGSRSSARRSAPAPSGRPSTTRRDRRHRPHRAPCARHRSAASSSRRSRSLASSSGGSKPCPLSSACSRSTRAQKPWMVKIAARSTSSAALAQAAAQRVGAFVAACEVRAAGCAGERDFGDRHSLLRVAGSTSTSSSASSRRSRMRLRSSCVAASVKVTASIWPTRRPRSTTSRVTSVARVKVLPVPATASIRLHAVERQVEVGIADGGVVHAASSASSSAGGRDPSGAAAGRPCITAP